MWQLKLHCTTIEDAVHRVTLPPTTVLALLVYAVKAFSAGKVSDVADFTAMCETLTKNAAAAVKDKKESTESDYYATQITDVWQKVCQAAINYDLRISQSKDPVACAIRATPVHYWLRSAPSDTWRSFLGLAVHSDKRLKQAQLNLLEAMDKCLPPIVFWWWNLNVLYHGKQSTALGNHREPKKNFDTHADIAQRNEFLCLVILAKFVKAAMVTDIKGGARAGPTEVEALMAEQENKAPRDIGVDKVVGLSPAEQIMLFGREAIAWVDNAEEPSLDYLHAALQACPAAVHLHGVFFSPLYRKLGRIAPDVNIPFALRYKMSAGMRQGLPAYMSRTLVNSLTMGAIAASNFLLTADPSGFTQVRNAERRVNFAPFAKVRVFRSHAGGDDEDAQSDEDSMEVEVVTQDPDAILANAASMATMAPLTAFRRDAADPEAQLHMWTSEQLMARDGFMADYEFHAQATAAMAELLSWLSAASESMKRQFALRDIVTGVFFPVATAKAAQLDGLTRQELMDLHLRLAEEQAAVTRSEIYTCPTGTAQSFLTFAAEALELAAPLEAQRLAEMATRAGKILLQRHMKLLPPKGVKKQPAWTLSTTVRDIIQGVCTGQFIDMEPLETAAAFAWVLLYAHAFFFFCRVLPTLHKSMEDRKELLAQLRDLQLLLTDARSALAHKASYCTVTRFAIEARAIRMEHDERRAAALRGSIAAVQMHGQDDEAAGEEEGQEDEADEDADEMEL